MSFLYRYCGALIHVKENPYCLPYVGNGIIFDVGETESLGGSNKKNNKS
jgi:hypothetical protein